MGSVNFIAPRLVDLHLKVNSNIFSNAEIDIFNIIGYETRRKNYVRVYSTLFNLVVYGNVKEVFSATNINQNEWDKIRSIVYDTNVVAEALQVYLKCCNVVEDRNALHSFHAAIIDMAKKVHVIFNNANKRENIRKQEEIVKHEIDKLNKMKGVIPATPAAEEKVAPIVSGNTTINIDNCTIDTLIINEK